MDISKDGIRLHKTNFIAVGQQIEEMLQGGDCYRLILKPWRDSRSIPQNSTFHMWVGEISAYLVKRGKTQCTPEWVKDALKHTYLGTEQKELVDVITGEVTVINSLRHTSELESGEMYDFMCRVEAWAMNIGCLVTIPESCEFKRLRDKQDD